MKELFLAFALIAFGTVKASETDFYATRNLQSQYAEAFATMPESILFHQQLNSSAPQERMKLVKAISQNRKLLQEFKNFNSLNLETQVRVLREIYELECRSLNIKPPKLVIDETSIPGYAFFEFDFDKGGAGTVYINKKKLQASQNKSEFLILLIHETRHSAQFQSAQTDISQPLGRGYKASFVAQKEMKINNVRTSFCDFMLLLNEYEAFQFANFVYGAIVGWDTIINDMGTLAGQFDEQGLVRINLLKILMTNPHDTLEIFNQLQVEQYDVMYQQKP